MAVEPKRWHHHLSPARTLLLLVNVAGAVLLLMVLVLYLYVGVVGIASARQSQLVDDSAVAELALQKTYRTDVRAAQTEARPLLRVATPSTEAYQSQERTARQLQETLFTMTVPGSWRELHLDLIRTYGLVEQAAQTFQTDETETAQTTFTQAETLMTTLIAKYPWIIGF